MIHGILSTLIAAALVAVIAFSGPLVGIQELTCDESSCDSLISQCACCPHLLRSIMVQEKHGFGSSVDSHVEAEFYGPLYAPPPHEIFHVPKLLS